MRVVWTPEALQDRIDIWDTIATGNDTVWILTLILNRGARLLVLCPFSPHDATLFIATCTHSTRATALFHSQNYDYPNASARSRPNTSQNCASCVVVKLMRISVLGWRSAWNRAPGASR